MAYPHTRVLVTGGLGFIGSNLAIRLAESGAEVVVVDSSVPGCGANPYNIAPVRDRVRLVDADIADAGEMAGLLRGCRVIFNLAGEISHVHSMLCPERDLQINTVAQLRFLLAIKEHAPGARVVYAGTRQVYGAPEYLPVDEKHPVKPVDFNGVHKYAAAMYHSMLTRSGDIDAVVLGLTNVYGPRMALDVPCQGHLSTFFRRLLAGADLEVYGDGEQLRDPVYVDDVVDAFLRAGAAEKPSTAYNVGGPEALNLSEIARLSVAAAGAGSVRVVSFPDDRKAIDIGSYFTDSSCIERELGWKPAVRFGEGVARTLDYYRAERAYYLDPNFPEPACKMPEHSGTHRRLTFAPV